MRVTNTTRIEATPEERKKLVNDLVTLFPKAAFLRDAEVEEAKVSVKGRLAIGPTDVALDAQVVEPG